MSIFFLKQPVLPPDVSVLQQTYCPWMYLFYSFQCCCQICLWYCTADCAALDISVLLQPVLPLDISVLKQSVPPRDMSVLYSRLCCPGHVSSKLGFANPGLFCSRAVWTPASLPPSDLHPLAPQALVEGCQTALDPWLLSPGGLLDHLILSMVRACLAGDPAAQCRQRARVQPFPLWHVFQQYCSHRVPCRVSAQGDWAPCRLLSARLHEVSF